MKNVRKIMTDLKKNKEILESYINFIVVHLKIEFERFSNISIEDQLNIKEIHSDIKLIVEEYLNKILYLIYVERSSNINMQDYFFKLIRNYKQKIEINVKKKKILQKISKLNIIYDYLQIIENLREFDLFDTELDLILAYLTMLNVKNRFEKLYILFCPFSRRCILPQRKSICNFPNYKICSEYQLRKKELKLSRLD